MAPRRIIWKLPERWPSLGLCDRTAIYPALHLRMLGFQTSVKRQVSEVDLSGHSNLVMVTDGKLTANERELVRSAQSSGVPIVFCPQNGIAASDRDLLGSSGVVALQMDSEALGSASPNDPLPRTVSVPLCGAHALEDAVLARELPILPPPDVSGGQLKGQRYVVVRTENRGWLLQCKPALAEAVATRSLRLVVAASEPLLSELPAILPDAIAVGVHHPGLLEIIAEAEILVCAELGANPKSPRPGQWVKTGLQQGVPVLASSHPSVDGMARLCICDDWERGLSLYLGSPFERAKAAVRAQVALSAQGRPGLIARRWAKILREAQPVARASPQKDARTAKPAPMLVSLLDLPQDLDLMLPILLAARESGALRLRVLITDWLENESPRTLSALADAGFRREIIRRAAARRGEFPALAGADAALSACDSTASPHKTGHAFARKAGSLGIASFTVQHGFENVGLNYRDHELGPEIRFGSETVFVWFPKAALPDWVSQETRSRLVHLGCPKLQPPPAPKLPSLDARWQRVVGVFENLHWRRYDDAYRKDLLRDLEQAAAANPSILFLVKPHHAGHWLHLNRGELQDRANVLIIDPTDPVWQPYTAPALIASLSAVITTPSTVAMDAARAGRPVAVLGYNLDLPLYAPLPIIRARQDWTDFLSAPNDEHLWCNEAFLARALLPGSANHRIASYIENAVATRPLAAAA